MTERVLSGVKVPLVGDDEKMHRAIERAVSDLKKLRTEIATTGVATEKQSRSVEDLEIRISSMLQQQEKSTSLYGASSSQLGKMREKVSATAGAMAGLTSQFGSAGGAIGRVGSIATQAFGAFAVGGPIALGVAAVGAGISYLVSQSAEQEAMARRAADATKTHAERMIDLTTAYKNVGASALESARNTAQAEAIKATATLLGSDEFRDKLLREADLQQRLAEKRADLRQRIFLEGSLKGALSAFGGSGVAADILATEEELNGLVKEREGAVARINEIFNLQIKIGEKQARIEGAKASAMLAQKHAAQDLLSLAERLAGPKLEGRTPVSQSEYENIIGRQMYGERGAFRSVSSSITPPGLAAGKTEITGAQFDAMVRAAEHRKGLEQARGFIDAMRSGGGMNAIADLFIQRAITTGRMSETQGYSAQLAMGIASSVAQGLADALKQGFNALASAVGTGIDFIAGSSKFGGIGGKAAQTAGSVFAGHMALGMAAGPLAAVTGGPVRGAALAAGAGVAATLPEVMMRATTETESYAKSMRAFDGIFRSITAAMEPVFDSFLPSIGLAGMMIRNLAQTLAPMNAALGDTMGRVLFGALKTLAWNAVNVAVGMDSASISAMHAANALTWLQYTTLQNLGLYEQAGTALERYNMGVAALNTQVSRHADLVAMRSEIEGLTISESRLYADHLSRLGQETDSLADGFSAVSSSMRNIPDFFNAARARRDASYDGDLGPVNDWRNDPGVNPAFADAPGMASGGFTVEAGGLFVAQMIVQSDNIQRINQQARYAAYASGSRSSGSSMPSKNNGYGGGGDFG